MENATKALLIAGSVLIAILLIALGMRVFNSGASASKASQSTMQTTAVATFNSQFTSFSGTQRPNKISSLVQKVIASNATNSKKVTINGGDATTYQIPTEESKISFYYGSDGYIFNIKIET